MSVNPTAFRRLMREIKQLQTEPPEGIRIITDEENILDVTGIIQGPDGTPYEEGYFRVKFKFTEEFPAAPPKCWFVTKIFHPNVSKSGEICVNTLKKDWKREFGIAHILVTVKCLLIYPNPESALDEAAGKLLLEKYEDYCKHARLMTSVHASPKTRPPEFDVPSVVPDSKPAATASTSASAAASSSNPRHITPPATLGRGASPAVTATSTTRHSTPAPTPLLSISANAESTIAPSTSAKPLSKAGGNTASLAESLSPPAITATSNGSNDQNVDPAGTKSVMMDVAPAESGKAPTTSKGGSVPLKRSGGATGGGAEKRKKGLKRL